MTTREKRLETHRRYNASSKGQARNARYEAKHPERKLRWSPVTAREVGAVNEAALVMAGRGGE